jgi:urea transport system permease protein
MKPISAIVAAILACLFAIAPARADEAQVRAIIAKFADAKSFDDTGKIVSELAGTGIGAASRPLQALADGDLQVRKSDKAVVIAAGSGTLKLSDPLSGETIGEAQAGELSKIKVNNTLRRTIRDAIGSLTLTAPDPAVRMKAAETLVANPDPAALGAIEAALAVEKDSAIALRFKAARAGAILFSDRPDAEKLVAIGDVAALGTRDAVSLLTRFEAGAQGELKSAAGAAMARVDASLSIWGIGQNVWYGISLGSVLLLAAIGLAITFGVMGVINMAHGEMVMLGAYTTFVVQEIMRGSAPWLLDWSLAFALPLAFLVSGTVGLAMERGIIRFLYGRPLETLLATWGLSLVLQQAVRTMFGPTNREVGNPSWASGAFELGQLSITYNRLWLVVFSLIVFFALYAVLNKTWFGLQMRAVTQNRRMASAIGIKTPWIGALTFAVGSGIAGIAGVGLSQIDNVSPDLGQSYSIDSFMVVVFGGVGNIWGTLVAAMTLGIVNKLLEPFAGAVLGKILVLVFIILFIQKRPRGLFALKGRFVEA